jgi:hypothetical protein
MVTDQLLSLTTKQALHLAMQRAMETQMVRLVEVWSANMGQIGETDAYAKFAAGLYKLASARDIMIEMIDEMELKP